MSLLDPVEVPVYTRESFAYDAATQPTTFGTYLGAKLQTGFDQSISGRVTDYLTDPSSGQPDQRRLTEDEWRKLKFDRPGLKFEDGQTVEQARARTDAFDERRYRDSLIERYKGGLLGQVAGFGAQMLGGLPSPENFIPFVGPGVRAAMVARLGVIGGHIAAGAADAAIGNLAADAITFPDLNRRGEDLGVEDLALDIGLGALTGGLFGAGGGFLARRRQMRDVANAVRLDGLQRQSDALELAIQAVARDEPVDVGPVLADVVAPGSAVRERIEGFGLPQARPVEVARLPAGVPGETIDIPGAVAREVETPEGPVIRAYHGSPHQFDRFSMEHIGRGEGNQAFGHGLYFAEREGVAKGYQPTADDYRGRLSYGGKSYDDQDLAEGMWLPDDARLENSDEALQGFKKAFDDLATKGLLTPASALNKENLFDAGYAEARRAIKDGEISREPGGAVGAFYTVDIHADPEHMLDWDKPLSEQSEHVKAALERAGIGGWKPEFIETTPGLYFARDESGELVARIERHGGGFTLSRYGKGGGTGEYPTLDAAKAAAEDGFGYDLVKKLSILGSPEVASQKLREAGIEGIRYLDGGSRADGDGTHNFVIFDDSRIRIREINGKAVERAPDPPASLAVAEQRIKSPPKDAAAEARQQAEDLGVGDPKALAQRLVAEEQAKLKAAETGAQPAAPKKPAELDDIAEMQDVMALKRAGALTDGDMRALAEADDLMKRADGWADAYSILSSCVLRFGQ